MQGFGYTDPRFFPQKTDQSGFNRNPGGTIPFPYPADLPSPIWNNKGQESKLIFSSVSDPPFTYTASWSSPLFDLRPYLRSVEENQGQSIPIWVPMGAGAKLWCQVYGLKPIVVGPNTYSQTYSLEVYLREWASVNNPNIIERIGPDVNITSEFAGVDADNYTRILQFIPPGQGYPVRWYKAQLIFKYVTIPENMVVVGGKFTSPINVAASYY